MRQVFWKDELPAQDATGLSDMSAGNSELFSAGELTALTRWLQGVQQVFPEIKWWKLRLVFGKYLLF
jgi:hypothetical protein